MNIDKIKMEKEFIKAKERCLWDSMTIMSYLDEYDEICKSDKTDTVVYIFYLPTHNWVVVQFEDNGISVPAIIKG